MCAAVHIQACGGMIRALVKKKSPVTLPHVRLDGPVRLLHQSTRGVKKRGETSNPTNCSSPATACQRIRAARSVWVACCSLTTNSQSSTDPLESSSSSMKRERASTCVTTRSFMFNRWERARARAPTHLLTMSVRLVLESNVRSVFTECGLCVRVELPKGILPLFQWYYQHSVSTFEPILTSILFYQCLFRCVKQLQSSWIVFQFQIWTCDWSFHLEILKCVTKELWRCVAGLITKTWYYD